jgi:aspartate carbamoyltransferase catalytic subunit
MSSLLGRHIVSISDLTNEEIEGIFRLSDRLLAALGGGPLSLVKRRTARGRGGTAERLPSIRELCAGQVLATVFFEPSTRTRLSFESAMQRMGGQVISVADARTSSAAKGERLADTVRVIAAYADVIVLRHPHEGAALLAAESLDDQRLAELGRRVPIINGGDGAHEHPTQTLCDLYTLRKEHRKIAGLNVALCGDLLHARTVHSLAYGLARFGASLKCISPPELRLPRYVKRRLELEFNCLPLEYDSLSDLAAPNRGRATRARGGKRRRAAQPLVSEEEILDMVGRLLDAVYITRIQEERFQEPARAEAVRGSYLVDPDVLRRIGRHTTIMHPLPRVDEVDFAVDRDTRAAYFRQASYGVPIRMALMAALLGKKRLGRARKAARGEPRGERPPGKVTTGVKCVNPTCITNHEPGLQARMEQVGEAGLLRCVYCDQEREAAGGAGGEA